MSTTGTEKHCRLCLMLSKGGTKACQYLLLKHVKDLKPRDSQPNEWTLASFLNSKKQIIINTNISKKKYKVLFPNTGDTVLSNWDLLLYCQVLFSYCDLDELDQLDIKNLRKIRNDLCHMNDAEITNLEFESKFKMIQTIIGRILEKLDDNDLKLEVDIIIKELESGSLSLNDTLDEMRKFYLMEMDIHEKLDHVDENVLETRKKLDHVDENVLETREKLDHVDERVLEEFEKLNDKLEIIIDQRASSGINSATNNVLVPGVDIFLYLKNVSDEEEKKMSDVLQQLFEEVINHNNDLKSSIPPNLYARLRTAVNETFHLFVSKGWRIKSAKRKCIKLHIKCSNFKSLADLFREHTNGKIHNHLTDLNEALAECVNGEKSYIETIIYKGEFWNVLDKSISFVDIYLSVLNIDVAKQNDNVQPLHKDRRATLSLTAQNVKSENNASFERDCNNELNTCLQLLKSELRSEFHAPHLSIQANCSSNVNRETDEVNLDGQDNMMQTIKSGDFEISKLCFEDKENSDRFQDEEYDKTAITQRSLKEIDPTKGGHERGKDHSEEKTEITKQNRRDRKLAMSRKEEEEAANWTKAISGLTITKKCLIVSTSRRLKKFLSSFSQEQLDHLSEFLNNTQNLTFKTVKGTKMWKISPGCCESNLCQTILDMLWEKHVNKSNRVVWSPRIEKSVGYNQNKKKVTLSNTIEKCFVCGESNCPFASKQKYIPLFVDTEQNEDVDKFYWEIANMFMFRGNERNHFPNSGPEDTDAALIFKLMKNCRLFSLDMETGIDNGIYDDLLEVRNLLMHSADNRLSDEALEECFKRMECILKASMFANEYSKKAISELKKLKDMRIIMTSLTSQQAAMIEEAFNLQQSSVEFDINVRGSLKNDYVLKGILKASQKNSRKYTGDADQTPAPSSQTRSPPSQTRSPPSQTRSPPSQSSATTLGGAATGAAVGSIAGPPGAAIGAAVGWLFGKLVE